MPGGSNAYDHVGDKIDQSDSFTTTSWRWRAATKLVRFDLGTSDVNRYEGDDCDDADADEEEQSSQANNGSTQTLEDLGHSTRECEDWTVYFGPVKYNNGYANATASNVSELKTAL